MSATTTLTGLAGPDPVAVTRRQRPAPEPIPMSRIVAVEFRKMFDTRAGFWLMLSIAIVAVVAQIAIIAFAPDSAITFETFATAMGAPLAIILPIIAILSVTSEWSQRSGLTTFTLVPHRGRVIWAKAFCAVVIGAAAAAVSLAIGSLGYLLGSTIVGVDRVWDLSVVSTLQSALATTIALGMGFVLGVLFRSSAAAIVGYFVYAMLLPSLFGALAAFQPWFADLQPWVDLSFSSTMLYDQDMTGEMWAQLGTSSLVWLVLPLALGLWLVRRSEVK